MKRLILLIILLLVPFNVQAKSVRYRTDIIFGQVTNAKKDGKVLGDFEIIQYTNGKVKIINKGVNPKFDYISYKKVRCHKGDIIQTTCKMNPNNKEPDDILKRTDKIIK